MLTNTQACLVCHEIGGNPYCTGCGGMTIHDLYHASLRADNAWHAELVKQYGRNAGTVRYTAAGRTGSLKPLHDTYVKAMCEWRNHPANNLTKGCNCVTAH